MKNWKPTKAYLEQVRDCEHQMMPVDFMMFSDNSSQVLVACPKCGLFEWIQSIRKSTFESYMDSA